MKRPVLALMSCIAIATAVFIPATKSVQAGSPQNGNAQAVADLSKAEDYCVEKGGEVDVRAPYYNTNDDEQNWFRLSGSRQFCKFTSRKTDHAFTSSFRPSTPISPR